MCEAHRHSPDNSEVYQAQCSPDTAPCPDTERNESEALDERGGTWEEEEYEWLDAVTGGVMLIKPKRPSKARTTPGAAKSAQKGSINQFRNMPNVAPKKCPAKGLKGRMICWRCGSSDHFWRDCPRPYNPDRFGTNGKGEGKPTGGEKGKSAHFTDDTKVGPSHIPTPGIRTEAENDTAVPDPNGGGKQSD